MLTGTQLATAITAVLIGAVALGWVLHWIWARLTNAAVSDTARIAEMVNRLHESDRARETSEEARSLAESLLATREAEVESQMTEMQTRLDGAVDGREADLTRQLREAQIDAETSMSGLRSARARIMEMEAEIEELERSLAKAEIATEADVPAPGAQAVDAADPPEAAEAKTSEPGVGPPDQAESAPEKPAAKPRRSRAKTPAKDA